ncbi:PCYCGC domain-containing protein [Paenibacillus sp. JCM 10914]|uniref:PCYCGC motif-containing (lipo)protein n=1 Tax=Paenibacillus sp. JCM 10914 TaxID=1236974 RepID=UPI0003CC8D70|nr:PCYCGC motif-containing (lipo)protein [Paenibacillus sp. JCM 10914]GAE04015.1 lipoprotein, putative [Paenibacillus sp. JCM 10914]
MRTGKQQFAILLLSVGIILSGCSGKSAEEQVVDSHDAMHEHGHKTQLVNGDIQEVTGSIDELPTFLNGQTAELQTIYALSAQVSDVLKYMPCYCGCGDSAGHESNLNCFIDEIREDGSVVWDDHGTRCGVCLDIAVESAKMSSEGMSLTEIRNAIDEKYGSGYANPTPTPMPPVES